MQRTVFSELGGNKMAFKSRVDATLFIQVLYLERPSLGSSRATLSESRELNLHRHDLAVAHRGAGLVCYSVTYLEYKSVCRAVYAIPLSHIRDIRELARNFLESDIIIFQTPY